MTKPSEAAKRRACEILGDPANPPLIARLALHLDAEDKAAREALGFAGGYKVTQLADFARRHILPDPKPTLETVLEEWRNMPGRATEKLATMIRDAGLLKETDCE